MKRAILLERGIDICMDTERVDAITYLPGKEILGKMIDQPSGQQPAGQDDDASPKAAEPVTGGRYGIK